MSAAAWAILALPALAAAGMAYEALARRRAARDFPPPGKMVDIGGRRIQLEARGSGTPTVVFEAGMDIGGALNWSAVHDEIAQTTRACAYSRAGIMWSDPRTGPHSGRGVAEDLHAALLRAGERPPFVLVGHSAGGPYAMIYAKYFPSEVAGLVFVDASHPEQEARFRALKPAAPERREQGIKRRLTALLARTGGLRAALAFSGKATPQEAALRAYAPASLAANLKETQAWEQTLAEAGSARDLGERPLYVLTATAPTPAAVLARCGTTAEQDRRMKEAWLQMHEEQAAWSSRSRHQVLADAGHYLQCERPETVAAAVRWVVDNVRAEGWR